jgi:hypothetical protein
LAMAEKLSASISPITVTAFRAWVSRVDSHRTLKVVKPIAKQRSGSQPDTIRLSCGLRAVPRRSAGDRRSPCHRRRNPQRGMKVGRSGNTAPRTASELAKDLTCSDLAGYITDKSCTVGNPPHLSRLQADPYCVLPALGSKQPRIRNRNLIRARG